MDIRNIIIGKGRRYLGKCYIYIYITSMGIYIYINTMTTSDVEFVTYFRVSCFVECFGQSCSAVDAQLCGCSGEDACKEGSAYACRKSGPSHAASSTTKETYEVKMVQKVKMMYGVWLWHSYNLCKQNSDCSVCGRPRFQPGG